MSKPEPEVSSKPVHVRFGDFEVDERNALLLSNGHSVALPPVPFGLLCALLRQSGTLLSKHALLDQVWGHRFVSDSVLKGAISDVRKALGDDPRQPLYIETLARRGYRFIATTATVTESAAPLLPKTDPVAPQVLLHNGAVADAASATLFVGRTEPLKRLHQSWQKALQGSRAIVWVAGEPGIGKTTLIERFVSELSGVVCIFGQCVQHYGAGEPYLPVLEALSELCRKDPAAGVLLRDVAPTWLLQLPWLCTSSEREVLLHELVGVNPQRMLREMAEFVDRYTEHHPLLLVTEDLQWADQSTIQLIDYMARRRGRPRLMWLSSFRLTEIIALEHPLNLIRHELRPAGLSDEILLDSFSEQEVAAYMAAHSSVLLSNECFVQTLHERTGGVPLFVASIANDVLCKLADAGNQDPALLAASTVPDSLGALIDHYIARLSESQHKLLTCAAVAGMELNISTLAGVLGWDELHTIDICDALVRERIWLITATAGNENDNRGYSYVFRHALYRQRLYDNTSAANRSGLHHKIGTVLEQQREQGLNIAAAELASHFDLGRMPLKALRYYAEAAQTALQHLSPSSCMSLTERALEIAARTAASDERTSYEITLATLRGVAAFHTRGAGDDAKKAYQHAVELVATFPQHPMTGLALYGLGFLLYLRAEYNEVLVVAERAQTMAALTENGSLTLAGCIIKGQVMMIRGQHKVALEVLQQALSLLALNTTANGQILAGYIVDPEVTVLTTISMVLSLLGRFTEAHTHMQQAYNKSRQHAQPMALLLTIWCDALCRIRRGDTAGVAALAREMQLLVDEYALAQGRAACRWFLGWADARCGNAAGAQQICAAYGENRALGMLAGSSETLGYAAEAYILAGDWQQAQLQLDQALEIVNGYDERIYLPQLMLIQAAIAHLRGDAKVEAESLQLAIAEARAQGAAWLELLALTAWCERGTPTPDELSALEQLLNTLSDSDDIDLLEQARGIVQFASR
ncbi:AAA family ATPase [Rheinheimera muenzenbergensis]|uniref:AAA family ATPase n=1 Tax=Rheinheimera muenzenbergensis TaxID=1193628 RepID=A0ABU8C1L0_9GAMM